MPRTRRVPDACAGPDDVVAASPAPAATEGSEPGAGPPQQELAGDDARHRHYAGHLRTTSAAIFHHAAMASRLKGIDPQSYILYHDRLLIDCGGPTDPVEVMLIEELSLAHFSLGLLFAKTSNAGQVEAVGIYAGAAARLMGEVRRTALALQAYRAASRQLAVAGPQTALALPEEAADREDDPGKNHESTEMGPTPKGSDEDRLVIPISRAATV